MDNVDFEYVRMRSEELLAGIGEADDFADSGVVAAEPDPVESRRYTLWHRLRRAIQMRRRSIRVLSDVPR